MYHPEILEAAHKIYEYGMFNEAPFVVVENHKFKQPAIL